jgi:site-specific recombinase XerD
MDGFISHLCSERRLADETVEAYRRDVHAANTYLKTLGVELATATLEHIQTYVRSRSQMGHSAATVARNIAAIRCFLMYQTALGQDRTAVAEAMERPKGEQRLPTIISEAQAAAMMDVPLGAPLALRDKAMLELLYGCGLRASELVGVRIDALDLAAGTLRVIGKGDRERELPLNATAARAVAAYLEARPPSKHPTLFLSYRGEPLDRIALWHIVGRHAERAGICKHVHPHVLRHAFASHMLSGGADLRVIQEMLGHADVTTTQGYVHVDIKRLKGVHALLGR